MKKLIFLFAIALALFSCEKYNDQFEGYDDNVITQVVTDLVYELTDDDYDQIGGDPAKYGNFSKYAPADQYIPPFLKSKYPYLDQGSIAQITYKYYIGGLSYLDYLTDAVSYELTTADYDSFGTGSGEPGKYNNFSSSTPPGDYLPGFFAAKYSNASNGDLVYVTYKYYSGSVEIRSEYYEFDGSVWKPVQVEVPEGVTVYALSSDDYDSMGEESGQPGRYNNFSGSTPPGAYLAKFLGIKFPYAEEGAKIAVVYRYYAGGGVTETRADEYTLASGIWTEYSSTINKSDQFIHTGENGWLFDPSVVFTMDAADYQTIVDYVKNNIGAEYIDKYGTAEAYYGAGAYYVNFDLRDGKWDSGTFSTWQDAVKEGIATGLLPNKFPDAVTQVSGVDVLYKVTFATYDGSDGEYTFVFKCTKAGPNPSFEFVEEI